MTPLSRSKWATPLVYLELARAHSAAGAALAVWVGGRLAGASWAWTWWHPMLVAFLLSAAGNAYNDAEDSAVDRLNRPTRPLPRGALPVRAARVFALLCLTAALLLAIPLGSVTVLGTLLGIALLLLYSPYLKQIPLLGNAAVGLLTGMAIGFGGLIGGNVPAVILPGVALGLLFGGREVLKTLYDYEGDRRMATHTVATVWGQYAAIAIATLCLIIAVGVLALWAGKETWAWLVPVVAGVVSLSSVAPLWVAPHSHRAAAWAIQWSKGVGLVVLVILAVV